MRHALARQCASKSVATEILVKFVSMPIIGCGAESLSRKQGCAHSLWRECPFDG